MSIPESQDTGKDRASVRSGYWSRRLWSYKLGSAGERGNMQEWTVSNGNRLKVRKNRREMLENEHSVRDMKGAFDGLISSLDVAKERIY